MSMLDQWFGPKEETDMTTQPAPADEDKTWLDDELDEPKSDETVVMAPLEGDDPSAEWDDRVAALNQAKATFGDEMPVRDILLVASWLLGEQAQPEA